MAFPDLDELIAEVDRTSAAAANRDGGPQPDWLALLVTAAELSGRLLALADDLVEDYVEHCRLHGCSWTDIGKALGVTRQAAQQRFLAPHRQYEPEELADELRAAMTHMKRIAVQHRNNYIGTEHLLWGLIAEDNTATRLLEGLDVSLGDLRRMIQARLSMGASQAAERIAWTPYSRKAMAIASELAAQDGSARISCAHLLVGLACVGRGVAATALAELGIDDTALAAARTKESRAATIGP
jgi:hypothetical protein